MFGLLVDSSLEEEIMLDCKHMMGPWSRELVAKCHCEGLRLHDPTAFSVIAPVEREIRREIAEIEARHAAIRRGLVGLSARTHTVLFAHLSAGRLTQEVRRMSKHVRPGQKPLSLHKEREKQPPCARAAATLRASATVILWRRLEAFHSAGNSRKEKLRSPTVGQAGPEVRELGKEERLETPAKRAKKAPEGECVARASHFGETRRPQQMRAKKHLREAALEVMRQEKRARVDEVEVVQEPSLQSMSRVAEPGTRAPITILGKAAGAHANLGFRGRFLHEAL